LFERGLKDVKTGVRFSPSPPSTMLVEYDCDLPLKEMAKQIQISIVVDGDDLGSICIG